jgi:hypothetical protein
MRKCLALLAVTAATAALLPATAATERYEVNLGVGWDCTANATVPNQTLLAAGPVGNDELPLVPTGGDSVIVGWGVDVGPGLGPTPQRLEVYRPQQNGGYKKVAESGLEMLTPKTGSFRVRIPVKGGERVGLSGPAGTLACDPEAGASALRSEGTAALGQIASFEEIGGTGAPVMTSVEPDHDGDGYGDYGQDRCEGSGSKGSDCPIGVHITRVAVKRRAILLEVTPKAFARIWLRGEFRWRERPDRPGEQGGLRSVDSRTRTKQVGADNSEIFRVSIPSQILRRLERLPRGKSMLAHISVFVTDRHGWENEGLLHIALWSRR